MARARKPIVTILFRGTAESRIDDLKAEVVKFFEENPSSNCVFLNFKKIGRDHFSIDTVTASI